MEMYGGGGAVGMTPRRPAQSQTPGLYGCSVFHESVYKWLCVFWRFFAFAYYYDVAFSDSRRVVWITSCRWQIRRWQINLLKEIGCGRAATVLI